MHRPRSSYLPSKAKQSWCRMKKRNVNPQRINLFKVGKKNKQVILFPWVSRPLLIFKPLPLCSVILPIIFCSLVVFSSEGCTEMAWLLQDLGDTIKTASHLNPVSLIPSHIFVKIMLAGSSDATLPASAQVPQLAVPSLNLSSNQNPTHSLKSGFHVTSSEKPFRCTLDLCS